MYTHLSPTLNMRESKDESNAGFYNCENHHCNVNLKAQKVQPDIKRVCFNIQYVVEHEHISL